MKKAQYDKNSHKSLRRGLLCGFAVGFCVVFVLMIILAGVMTAKDISESAVSPMATVILSVGSFFAGMTASKINGTKGLVIGSLCGALIFLVSLVLGVISGGFVFTFLTVIRLIAVMLSAICGGVAGVNIKPRSVINLKS